MRWLCWPLALIFAIVSLALVYVFLIRGQTLAPDSDGRSAVVLAPAERDLVLAEMRAFLAAVQQVTAAAAADDLAAVAVAARQVGAAAQQEVPPSLMRKLPLQFKTLGLDTHQRFDQLALDAEQLGDPGQTLGALGLLLQNCVACHAAYKFALESP